jgi:hypothetical protein
MEQSVEARHPHASRGGFHVLEKGRETADDFPCVERFGDPAEFLGLESGFRGAGAPRRRGNFVQLEFPLQRDEHLPLERAEFRHMDRGHRRRHVGFAPGLDRLPANVTDAQSKNTFRRHQAEMIRAHFFREQLAMMLERKSARNFQGRPKLVVGSGRDGIRRT